jgi:ribosomal protein L37AE/L43A
LNELHDLAQIYGLSCPSCERDDLTFSIYDDRNVVKIECALCTASIKGPQQLTEETGPHLAEILRVTRNQGRWKARWEMLAERKGELWGEWIKGGSASQKRKSFKKKLQQNAAKPVCPKCGSPMRLINPRPGNRWNSFWGCTKYKVTGCKGSAKYEE